MALTRLPEDVYLADVYDATASGPLFALHKKPPNPDCPVGSTIQRVLEPTLREAELALLDKLADTTLAHVLQRIQEESR